MSRLTDCRRAYSQLRGILLAELSTEGHWVGELSSSALSTATAVMALRQVERSSPRRFPKLIAEGEQWLLEHQNSDGGWGDTIRSHSNVSTTMLVHATLVVCAESSGENTHVARRRGEAYVEAAGGRPTLLARYGKDRTFSIPILTHCALAGLVPWREILPLPFELACLPANLYRFLRLPVVSYALPALIAIGQVRHHQAAPRFPPLRWLRNLARAPSLRVLQRIQPASGGYLEATPLTSFVAMSLAAMSQAEHPVVRSAIRFLEDSVRADGSWPIDTNLATWGTTLAIHALGPDLPEDRLPQLRQWLLGQQWREPHPYTNADPGGWAWTNLTGGVPDADDTPGALLALMQLDRNEDSGQIVETLAHGSQWLLDLQNRDGGWPTFCRGWGLLPFDRSAADLTAHALRALDRVGRTLCRHAASPGENSLTRRLRQARERGLDYLAGVQRSDGSWLPLWFGNQDAPGEENPTYGTARVLLALRDLEIWKSDMARRGISWLLRNQNPDGGFGGGSATPSSLEETSWAVESLCSYPKEAGIPVETVDRALGWLAASVDREDWRRPSPIGLYFAKLWYFEKLYPLVYGVAALRRGCDWLANQRDAN
jgi:squalene-hopene/tetraprenyl-beta-curcumene cyclase